MAKIYLSKLQQKYNFSEGEVTGLNYRKLMKDIITNEDGNIARATARISKDNYKKQVDKLIKRPGKETRIVLPDVSEALPKRSVFLRKGADSGNYITDTLRDKLTKNLRNTLDNFKTSSGEQSFVRRRGTLAGTINPKVISAFEKSIKGTFQDYTKKDPMLGIPKNIHGIAVTEVRSTIDAVKHNYNKNLLKKNSGRIEMFKIWRQNKSLSREPRLGHSKVNGIKKPMNEAFDVPVYIKRKGKWVYVRTEKMQHSHDSTASVENVIQCNCEIEYYLETKDS